MRPTPLVVRVLLATKISFTPEFLAEIERVRRLERERPWEPITFGLDSVEMADRGFSLSAAGIHYGRAFSFAMTFTMFNGPVALCEWSPNGVASEALLDILAHYADVPRAASRFDELVKTSAIILRAEPSKAVPAFERVSSSSVQQHADHVGTSFAQLTRLYSKIVFELAEGKPEIFLNLDFASERGHFAEKDAMYRKRLVHAFQNLRSKEEGSDGGSPMR